MRKTLFLLVFLLLVALAHTEIPELIHLSDDISNDFGATSFGCRSVQVAQENHVLDYRRLENTGGFGALYAEMRRARIESKGKP